MAEEDLNGTGTPFSLSFSGSGFLALYQIGVVQSLLELAPEILKSASKVYGASAGSLIAAAVVCESSLEDLKESFHEAVRDARKTILGPLSPGCNTLRTIQKGLYKTLPENSHQVASGRLHISLTRVTDGQNVMVSEFSSKEDLIQALICSCFVPIYCGFIPPSFRGVRYVDGGFTNLQPCSDLEAVITVSPFTGELDICPRDCPAIFYSFQIFNSSIQISVENLCRISYALFPPSYLVLNEFFSRGYQDAVLFLHRNNAFGINYPANTVTFRFASLLSKNDLSRANEESSCQNPDTGGLESNGPAPRDLPPKQAAAVSGTLNGTDQKIQPQLPPCQHKAAQERQKASGLLDSVAEIISQCLMSYKLPTKMMFSLSKRIEQLWALLDEMCWMAQQFKRTGRLVRNTAAGLSNGVVSERRLSSLGMLQY
ncbi:patatin-like phospholipase domain-containing protein 1 [Trachemys scripta elegans]|uniref:patatin-like phospholipase domain-containing protein 1 n=1 Tax=Trachemys scripta elegans TaxID=31138 RepID=UPI001554701A|nr:patatin-like phospholipase domain-containing protein 1 [Trachemys scripta elegans]